MALLVSSLPLSLTTILGLPRSITSRSSSRDTRMPESEVSATSARHSRVQSSTMVRMRKRRPQVSWSDTKSSDHRRHRNQHRRPGPDRSFAAAAAAYRQLLFPVEPEQFLVVDQIAFPLEQNMQPSVAEAAALLGNRFHALTKAGVVSPGRLVSHGHAAAADGF